MAVTYNPDTLRAKKVLTFYDLHPGAKAWGAANSDLEVQYVIEYKEWHETRIGVRGQVGAIEHIFAYAFASGLVMVVHEDEA